jgi:hypothetical protein
MLKEKCKSCLSRIAKVEISAHGGGEEICFDGSCNNKIAINIFITGTSTKTKLATLAQFMAWL